MPKNNSVMNKSTPGGEPYDLSQLNNAGRITIPVCVIENSADTATPAGHPRKVFDLLGSQDKEFHRIQGATHYYRGQPQKLREVVDLCLSWLSQIKIDT